MKGLKLIRRMEIAGFLRWFPVDGTPVMEVFGGRFCYFWTTPVYRTKGGWTYRFPTPDDVEADTWVHAEHENGKHAVMREVVEFALSLPKDSGRE